MSLEKIISEIRKHDVFLITTHVNPEGDALGSVLAFYRLLVSLGKKACIYNEDKVPYGYDFLPGVEEIKLYKQNIKHVAFDCFVVLDCSDLKRTGEVYRLNKENKPVINIDHHISNIKFGDINWINPKASSACQMVYELYGKMNVKIDKEAALLLYVGIVTDTGSFRYSNTDSSTHLVVADLLRYGLDIPSIFRNLYCSVPFCDMQLLIKTLGGIRRCHQGKIVWVEIKEEVLKECRQIHADFSDYVLSFIRMIKDAEVAILLKENLGVKNEVRINFRSQGKVDVNAVAAFFGGGGHKTASGCTMKGSLTKIRKQVILKIEEKLNEMGL